MAGSSPGCCRTCNVTTALIHALNDQKPEVLVAAARALHGRDGDNVTKALLTTLSDPILGIRKAAAEALGGRDGDDVTEALLTTLSDPALEVRQTAAAILPWRPVQTVIARLAARIDVCDMGQVVKICSGLHPLAWSMNTMNATDRNELFSLLGAVTDSIPYDSTT